MKSDLQQRVDEALDVAVFENGYTDTMDMDAKTLAIDLVTYSPDLEDEDEERVVVCAQNYLGWYHVSPTSVRTQPRR